MGGTTEIQPGSQYRYRSCGLTIDSERPLPGLPPALIGSEPCDVWFEAGPRVSVGRAFPIGTRIVDPDRRYREFYGGVRGEDGFLLRFFDQCDVHVSNDLRHVEYRRDHNADDGFVDVLLAGTTLAFVASLHGYCVLHASAVEVNGRALAFIGHSGLGKSTLAVASCAAGAQLIAEDVLVVNTHAQPQCLAGNTAIRLRKGSLSLLNRLPDAERITMPDGRDGVRPPLTASHAVPLDTLVIPRPARQAKELSIEELPAKDALFRIIKFPRVNGLCEPAVVQRQFEGASAIARAVPVLMVSVPWGPPFQEDLGERLIKLMNG